SPADRADAFRRRLRDALRIAAESAHGEPSIHAPSREDVLLSGAFSEAYPPRYSVVIPAKAGMTTGSVSESCGDTVGCSECRIAVRLTSFAVAKLLAGMTGSQDDPRIRRRPRLRTARLPRRRRATPGRRCACARKRGARQFAYRGATGCRARRRAPAAFPTPRPAWPATGSRRSPGAG